SATGRHSRWLGSADSDPRPTGNFHQVADKRTTGYKHVLRVRLSQRRLIEHRMANSALIACITVQGEPSLLERRMDIDASGTKLLDCSAQRGPGAAYDHLAYRFD